MSYVTLTSTPLNWQNYITDPNAIYNGGGFANSLSLYKNGGRILLNEAWGWSVYDNSNPLAPRRLSSRDVRFPIRMASTGGNSGFYSLTTGGDGQSATQGFCVSPDGQRLGAYMGGASVSSWREIFADALGEDFKLEKAINMPAGNGQVIQQIAGRYIVYSAFMGFRAFDITTLPSSGITLPGTTVDHTLEVNTNIMGDAFAPGYISIKGNFLANSSPSGITIVNISNPGPIGSITTNMPHTIITPSVLGLVTGQNIQYFVTSVDPVDSSKLWLLISVLGPSHAVSYYLVSVTSDLVSTVIGTPWSIPNPNIYSQNAGIANSLTINNGILYVMMWDQGIPTGSYSNSSQCSLYSTSVDQWININTSVPPNKFQLPADLASFSIGQHSSCLSVGSNIYMYLPCGPSAYVVPLTCMSSSSSFPPTSPLNVTIDTITQTSGILNANTPSGIGAGIGHYNVYVNGTIRQSLVAPYFPFTLYSLVSNTSYSIQVSLVDITGVESTKSDAVTFTTLVAGGGSVVPTVPLNVINSVGATPDSVKITWAPPSSANGTLINYTITNKVSNATNTVGASTSPLETTFSSLSYDTPYTFGVKVNNATGLSSETVSSSIALTAPINAPSAPTNVIITVLSNVATLTWQPPISTGSGPIVNYKVDLHNNTDSTIVTNIFNSSIYSYTVSGLTPGDTYYFTVSATNTTIAPFVYGTTALSFLFNPEIILSGKQLVKHNLNYVKFYEAPIVLDKTASNYTEAGTFIYPQNVSNLVPSLISNNFLTVPIIFESTNCALAIKYQSSTEGSAFTHYIKLGNPSEPLLVYYDSFTSFVEHLQSIINSSIYPYPFEVISISDEVSGNNTLIFRALGATVTKGFILTSEDPIIDGIQYTNVNDVIFGLVPTYFEGYEEPLVENYIPTPAYDNVNHKALVESRVIATRKNLVVDYKLTTDLPTFPRIEEDIDTFKIIVGNVPLNPKQVNLSWYNSNGQYTHLVDYDGDGLLLEKIKFIDEFGNITYSYEPLDSSIGYGIVDYTYGTIKGLILKDYRPASILGVGTIFPLNVLDNGNNYLSLKLNSVTDQINIMIPPGIYGSAKVLVDYLNNDINIGTHIGFLSYKLQAGQRNGQVFIINTQLGPNHTLTTKGVTFGNLTIPIFGFNPIEIIPPPIYISYSFSLNQNNKNQYIWYQTPHFIIRVKNKPEASLFTAAHLNYILTKTDQFRPATSVLDTINIRSDITETVNISDKLDILEYTGVTYPYIIVDLIPSLATAFPDSTSLGPYDITVKNPDNQLDIETASYTYIL